MKLLMAVLLVIPGICSVLSFKMRESGKDFGKRTQLPDYPCAFVFNRNESKNGIFHSPNYPEFYPKDTECHYFFHGNHDEKVHIHFNHFDIEGKLPCDDLSRNDHVEFSNFMARDRKYSRHCGQLKEFDVDSDRKFFRVTFRTNNHLEGTGFNATFHFLNKVETSTKKTTASRAVESSFHLSNEVETYTKKIATSQGVQKLGMNLCCLIITSLIFWQ